MTWNTAEAKIINDLVETTDEIKTALVGGLNPDDPPGIVDEIHYLKRAIEKIKEKLKKNHKQHIILFIVSGVGLFLVILHAYGNLFTVQIITQFLTNIIKAAF